jgi:hypothetical protein
MWKRGISLRSKTIQVAQECGFLDEKEALQADSEALDLNGSEPILEFLVDRGFLDEKEADIVSIERFHRHPESHLIELAKQNRSAIRKSVTSTERLHTMLSLVEKRSC